VVIALIPAIAASIWFFQWYAVVQISLCVLACLATEAVWQKCIGKPLSISDSSAAVTGVILALSLPWSAPFYVPLIASVVAISLGKMVFGGVGMNLFNPAMVGRAFVMLSFAQALGAGAYMFPGSSIEIVTQATPLTIAKSSAAAAEFPGLWPLFIGQTNGSLGETSALAILAGGLYLCFRRTAAWQIPAGVLIGTVIFGTLMHELHLSHLNALQHCLAGSLLFGAFFIATDPVSSPITPLGRWIFGVGVGLFVVFLRTLSSYPEGVMFAVLLMNAVVPLINRWTIPVPKGGLFPVKK
jgi:Na+-translocating ferredoxin:NAD+ oxidoreductase subunit D